MLQPRVSFTDLTLSQRKLQVQAYLEELKSYLDNQGRADNITAELLQIQQQRDTGSVPVDALEREAVLRAEFATLPEPCRGFNTKCLNCKQCDEVNDSVNAERLKQDSIYTKAPEAIDAYLRLTDREADAKLFHELRQRITALTGYRFYEHRRTITQRHVKTKISKALVSQSLTANTPIVRYVFATRHTAEFVHVNKEVQFRTLLAAIFQRYPEVAERVCELDACTEFERAAEMPAFVAGVYLWQVSFKAHVDFDSLDLAFLDEELESIKLMAVLPPALPPKGSLFGVYQLKLPFSAAQMVQVSKDLKDHKLKAVVLQPQSLHRVEYAHFIYKILRAKDGTYYASIIANTNAVPSLFFATHLGGLGGAYSVVTTCTDYLVLRQGILYSFLTGQLVSVAGYTLHSDPADTLYPGARNIVLSWEGK